jgi:hypothetical protein
MKTKREESILDILATFEELADLVLVQLTLLEKYMADLNGEEQQRILLELTDNENKIDK